MTSHIPALLAHGFTRHASNERLYSRAATSVTNRLLAQVNPDKPAHITLWSPNEHKMIADEQMRPQTLADTLADLGVTPLHQ